MKKLVIVYVVLIIVVILLAVFKIGGGLLPALPNFGTKSKAVINKESINLIVVKAPNDLKKGLSGRKDIPQDQGMLFIFPTKGKYSFWMKDMLFPLDIIFIDDKKVVDVFENLPPDDSPFRPKYAPSAPANYVLEVNAGVAKKLKIQKGTTVTLKNVK